MTDTTFVAGTTITKEWLNDVNREVYDLSSTSSAAKGAGLVGYNDALTYTTGTVGYALQNIPGGISFPATLANDFAGVDPYGNTDSYAGLVAAIAGTPAGGTLVLDGYYRCSAALAITKTMTIQGTDNRTGNVPDPGLSRSSIYFYNNTRGFTVTGVVASFKSIIMTGNIASSTLPCIYATGTNNSVKVSDCVIQSFWVGIWGVQGYYNKIHDTSIVYCNGGIKMDSCYNVYCAGLTISVTNGTPSVAVTLLNGSSLSMHGGAVEGYTGTNGFGAILSNESILSLFGVYLEGSGGTGTYHIGLNSGSHVTAIGCHVYLTACERFISTLGGPALGCHIYSKNNFLILPTDTTAVNVYEFLPTDSTGFCDISGDNWVNNNGTPGANVKYLSAGVTGGTGPVVGVGNYQVQYPATHPLYGHNVNTVPGGISSGTYTPTIVSHSGFLNAAGDVGSSPTANLATWFRVGDIVSVSGTFSCTIPDSAGNIKFHCPIISSTRTGMTLAGNWTSKDVYGVVQGTVGFSGPVSTDAFLELSAGDGAVTNSSTLSYTFQYNVT